MKNFFCPRLLTGLKHFCLVGLVSLIFFLLPACNVCSTAGRFNAKGADFSLAINEIAWMGTATSANDEWIELYNNTKNNLSLEGWILKSEDGLPEIKLNGTIPANGFYLLERTDDNTVTEIIADLIYRGSLSNSGERLKLYDSSGNLVDEVNSSGGWFAGDNKSKKVMERINPLVSGNQSSNWQTSQAPAGTPKAKNFIVVQTEPQSQTKPDESAVDVRHQQPAQQTIIYPIGIIINELLPSPEGPDAEEEWVELLNQNSFEVDLSGWKIEDTLGKITTFTLPKETKISAQGFLVFSRPTTKISLNNDGDGLVLFSPDGKTIDSVNYSKAPRGQSYSRTGSDWLWSVTLTPGAANITEKTETRSLEDGSASGTREKRELAAVGEQITKSSKFLFVLLIALGLAIFSGIIILILKKKLKKDRPI